MKNEKPKKPEKKAKPTLSNIKGFLQGNFRKLKEDLLNLPLSPVIKEQIEWRATTKAKACIENGACLYCGCDMPEKLYEDRGCENPDQCYPDMMSEQEWEKFKTENQLK